LGERDRSCPHPCRRASDAPIGDHEIDLDNFRRREWAPSIEAAGIRTPARIYDLRSTFATDALAAGIGIHALARVMGTSTTMIERHYGTLLDGAMESIASRLDALDAERDLKGNEVSR
jgi:integrase